MRITTMITALLLLLSVQNAQAEALLTPGQAFVISAPPAQNDRVQVSWQIADGYYLLRDKIRFASETGGVSVGTPVLPAAQTRDDPVFGKLAIYQGQVTVDLPVQRSAGAPEILNLKIVSQGCKLEDPCFPPHTQTLLVALSPSVDQPPQVTGRIEPAFTPSGTATDTPPALPPLTPPPAQAPAADPLAELSALGASLGLGGDGEDELLTPEQAYQFSATVADGRTLKLHWTIAKDTYLYQDKIGVSIQGGDGVVLGSYTLPKAEIKPDTIRPDGTIGDVAVYHNAIDLTVPLLRTATAATSIDLTAKFQGCAERGICYPPMKQKVTLELPAVTNVDDAAAVAAAEQAGYPSRTRSPACWQGATPG